MWNRAENKVNCIFIRHGATASNRQHRYLGRTDEELDEAGILAIKQSIDEGYYDKLLSDKSVQIKVFSSPMKRCMQTARLIYPKAQIEIIDELSEMDFGDFELKNYEELSNDPLCAGVYQAWIDSGGTSAFPNGESREAFIKRSVSGFRKAMSRMDTAANSQKTAVFVVHGGTIMAIMSHYCGGNYFDYQVKNGEGLRCTLSI